MLDINKIRHEAAAVSAALAKRGVELDFTAFLAEDAQRRALIHETEELKAQRNLKSQEVPQLKKQGLPVEQLLADMKDLAEQIKANDQALAALELEQESFLLSLPNLPHESVVAGGKEANEVQTVSGTAREFDFSPKHHVELAQDLGLIDYERGVKLGGSGFWLYRGQGALLERALLNYFIDCHLRDGYEFILPPHILTYDCGLAAGQFPKFEEDVFPIGLREESTGSSNRKVERFLLPTAETALVNIFRGEILEEAALPFKCFSLTPCYRREAGSYRADERGMIRGHQFNKVEMFQFAKPEASALALQELIAKAEQLVRDLGLHYRLVKLAAGDVSASMQQTWDIEVWLPSMNGFKEVSSISNAGDYQARRGNIRFRAEGKKPEYVHTLNGSGLATSRIFPAILEQFQAADGSVLIPEVLQPYMGGLKVLRP